MSSLSVKDENFDKQGLVSQSRLNWKISKQYFLVSNPPNSAPAITVSGPPKPNRTILTVKRRPKLTIIKNENVNSVDMEETKKDQTDTSPEPVFEFTPGDLFQEIARDCSVPVENIQLIADIMNALEDKRITRQIFKQYMIKVCQGDDDKFNFAMKFFKDDPVRAVKILGRKLIKQV